MKITLVILGLIVLKLVNCNVTNRVKDVESTTGFSTKENSAPRDTKEVTERTHKDSKKENKEYVYLENVLYALIHQNWTEAEQPCLNQTLRLIHSLQNFTLWAVWDWDSIASEPLGLLYGNRYQLGNFDECLYPTWAKENPELKTQYCLSEIVLERTDHSVKRRNKSYDKTEPYGSALDHFMRRVTHSRPINELTWGVCVPAICSPLSVERLLATMLARSHLAATGMKPRIAVKEKCQTAEPLEFDGLFYAFVITTAILALICLVSTYKHCRDQSSNQETNVVIKSFCLKENGQNLLEMKKEGAEVLYGIRFLTICLIVLDHQIGIQYGGPISNGLSADGEVYSVKALLILHDDLFVDTFFFLSGFLLATTLARFKRVPNIFILILKRYIRLVVAFAVVIFYICAVFPYTGSGPLWNRAIEGDTDKCKKTWWISLLMLNNYIDTENICLVVSWYIASDFHFFLVTLIIYCIYKRYPKIGITLGIGACVASIIATSVINYVHKLTPVQLFTYQFVADIRGNEQFHLTYIKSHTRYPPYFIGFLSGFLFIRYKTSANNIRIPQNWSIIGCLTGLLIMFAVMVDGVTFLWRDYHPAEGALYAAFNRPVWTCGLALMFFCLAFGRVPLIEGFLSWYPWVPLSRLAYGLYLTHSLFIARNVFSTRNSVYYDDQNVLTVATGIIFWGSISSLLIWLLAEGPINNLVLALFSVPSKKKVVPDVKDHGINSQTTAVATIANSSGNFHDNLPSVVCFSKM
ncbi:nose resistant to fluoxetine protein 6 [Amyelois transitella]|uniref:nose resistant to fluoxetine protein 6 n=1 Tax=Amyelois transitella TaxID=680683 RepID=UPI0029905107|nr:nose resistant to fluoxetine protein 6 [Amyelois transitella]